jgi:hypothetical protein
MDVPLATHSVCFAKLIDSIDSRVHLPREDSFEGVGAGAMEICSGRIVEEGGRRTDERLDEKHEEERETLSSPSQVLLLRLPDCFLCFSHPWQESLLILFLFDLLIDRGSCKRDTQNKKRKGRNGDQWQLGQL